MATLDQLASHIRFQLEQLSGRNGHHEFEHLCRWLARKRICSNLLPATGPVSGSGDQGRDFETFRTYLNKSPIADSSFIGVVSDGPIAFACTLTKQKRIEAKIRSDIETIMDSGTPIISIHYFCTADVKVGLRHKLQGWAKQTHGVHLEIHDGQAISEDLTDQDIFWLAVQFLHIPAEIYPNLPSENTEEWYDKLLKSWRETKQSPDNYAEFSEIKRGIRHATFTEVARKDLPFWIQQMESLLSSTSNDALRRKATYEIAVASLRGLGSMIGYEDRLRTYFTEIPTLVEPSDLDDAANLYTYCVGGYHHNAVQITPEDLRVWHASIVDKLESELESTIRPGKRCFLLQTRGHLHLSTILEQPETFTINKTMDSWLELASLVDRAPLFPLENFADRLTKFLELPGISGHLENHPDFSKLTQRLDELLATRHGAFVAAEKCRDRAMAFYKQGEILRAIKEIHKSKIQWFAKETLRGSLLAALFVSNCYQELGLVFAAKYYALAAAYIAVHNSDHGVQSLIAGAINIAANCDYSIGAYCGFFDLTDVNLSALGFFSRDVDIPENEISKSILHTCILRAILKRLNPDLIQLVDDRLKNWQGLEDYFVDLIPKAEEIWSQKSVPDIWTSLEEQVYGRPFSDLGQFRQIEFYALGITWRFRWENTYELTAIAEEIVAVVQIVLADIADTDLCLLRTTIEVEIGFGIGNVLKEMPSNELAQWRLTLISNQKDDPDQMALQLATSLLRHASLLPDKQFLSRLEIAFREGLSHKAFFGQRYSVLYREFIAKERFESTNRVGFSSPESDRPFKPVVRHQLSWHGDLVLSYSEEATKQVLKKRYENSVRPIRYTLKRLMKNQSFIEVMHSLREKGWLDWHILTAISMIVINYRVNKEMEAKADADQQLFDLRFQELALQLEPKNAISVPISEFSEENLRILLWTTMPSTLRNLGLELHQITPDFEAISDFLGERYRYWQDDIDHPSYGF